jgi:hypothetical protein
MFQFPSYQMNYEKDGAAEARFSASLAAARDGNGYPKPEYPTGITR